LALRLQLCASLLSFISAQQPIWGEAWGGLLAAVTGWGLLLLLLMYCSLGSSCWAATGCGLA